MPTEQATTVTLTREEAEVLSWPNIGQVKVIHWQREAEESGKTKLRAALDNPQPESYTREEVAERLLSDAAVEADGRARWFGEPNSHVRRQSRHGLEAALSAAFPDQQPEPLDERQERLEAELSDTEAAIERKRQEDGP